MPDVTSEQVLAQIRFAVSYQKVRFPKMLSEVTAAADKLVQSLAFRDFVVDVLVVAPETEAADCDCEECHGN